MMTQIENRQNTRIIAQLFLIALVTGGGVLILYFLGVFSNPPKDTRSVTYKVGGTTSSAVITYLQEDGKTSPNTEISVPWQKALDFKKGTVIILTAANPTHTGLLNCRLLIDGQPWKNDDASTPEDKVSCAGIVP